ncbi:MAG: hypothetical protein R2851_14115 [Caldilineaceae bacterium]
MRRVRGFAPANVGAGGGMRRLWVMRRLAVDNSYWQGRLKLNEALRHVLISFTSGETMRAGATALWLLLGFALVTVLAGAPRAPVPPGAARCSTA